MMLDAKDVIPEPAKALDDDSAVVGPGDRLSLPERASVPTGESGAEAVAELEVGTLETASPLIYIVGAYLLAVITAAGWLFVGGSAGWYALEPIVSVVLVGLLGAAVAAATDYVKPGFDRSEVPLYFFRPAFGAVAGAIAFHTSPQDFDAMIAFAAGMKAPEILAAAMKVGRR